MRPCLYQTGQLVLTHLRYLRELSPIYLLAITLVPVLMLLFLRGKLHPESRNPFATITKALYLPVLKLCLRYRKITLLANLVFLAVTFPLARKLGSQFMPALYEGSALYMSTALPGIR